MAAELEARWNTALQKTQDLENKLSEFDNDLQSRPVPNKEVLLSLAQDLPAIWNSPATDMRLKQRLIRIVVNEIVSNVDEESREVVLVIHWAGGRHSELRVKKNRIGEHRRCTNIDAIAVIRQMATRFSDEQIAATLNRLGLRTGAGNTRNQARVHSARQYHSTSQLRSQPSSRWQRDFEGSSAAAEYRLNNRATHDRRKETAGQSNCRVCAVADSGGSPGIRRGSKGNRQSQEWQSRPANGAGR